MSALFDLCDALELAEKRGYNPTQTSLFVLALSEYSMAAEQRIRAIRGMDEIAVEISAGRTEVYRYQYGKACVIMVAGAPRDVATVRRAGDWPEILNQRYLA